jgi:hypothetical protein
MDSYSDNFFIQTAPRMLDQNANWLLNSLIETCMGGIKVCSRPCFSMMRLAKFCQSLLAQTEVM